MKIDMDIDGQVQAQLCLPCPAIYMYPSSFRGNNSNRDSNLHGFLLAHILLYWYRSRLIGSIEAHDKPQIPIRRRWCDFFPRLIASSALQVVRIRNHTRGGCAPVWNWSNMWWLSFGRLVGWCCGDVVGCWVLVLDGGDLELLARRFHGLSIQL